MSNVEPVNTRQIVPSPGRARWDLFLVSLVILFLELACIRWFPVHILFLTFFTNTVLLACFLWMSLGCLAVNHKRNYLAWTPGLIGLGLAGPAHSCFVVSGLWLCIVLVLLFYLL